MAVLDRITCGEKEIFSVDADPRTSGFVASMGSFAAYADATKGYAFLKVGVNNTDWEIIITGNDLQDVIEDIVAGLMSDTASIKWTYDDVAGTLKANVDPIGVDHDALTNFVADEHVAHSSVSITGADGCTGGGDLTASRTITLPAVGTAGTYGDSISVPVFTTDIKGRVSSVVPTVIRDASLTQSGVVSIGVQSFKGFKTFDDSVIINGDLQVNGTTTTINTQELLVKDPLITLNDGGTAATAVGAGVEIEADGAAVAKMTVGANSWNFNTINSIFEFQLSSENLTANHLYKLSNEDGTFVLRGPTSGVNKQVSFFNGTLLSSATGVGADSLIWDAGKLGIGVSAPKGILHRNKFYENFFLATSSDATPVVATSIAVAANTTITVELRVNGTQTAGSGGTVGFARGYVRTATIQRVGASIRLLKVQSDFTAEEEGVGNVTIQLSGNDIQLVVIGGANRNISWHGHYSILETPAV